ncbi:MAG TPA: Nif3-like dinuclear metal center hexameric protein, partial [Firmicutes bacterium]|nr:Nif3-like dinuclear metal center hexameric protein [Bacillota bacterium]
MKLSELVYYLDNYLEIDQVADVCVNGLEVECGQEITKIALAVDPAEQVFRKADQEGAQLVLLHHGLFWKEAVPITGPLYRRLRFLLRRDMAVYAAHLPLDIHEEVGHNAILAGMIGLANQEPFVLHKGKPLGYIGQLPGIHRSDLADRLGAQLGVEPALWAFGRENVSRVAVCSGKADSELAEA